jgi:TolB-like protein
LAPIGGILVSESVNRNIGNKANIVSTFLREEQLRNVTEPIKIYAVQIDNVQPFDLTQDLTLKDSDNQKVKQLTKWTIGSISAILLLLVAYLFYSNSIPDNVTPEMPGKELANSIVILPFENLSNDPEQDYFGIGMMDEILNKLVKINGLKVISRTTAMGYHGKDLTANEIAQELGVATVLEGSIRKEGDQVRITVQLIDGASDTHLFSESYDRQLNDIFQLQSEVAQKVANSLTAQISPEVKLNLEAIPTKNMVAYELYLRGREQMGLYWMGSPFTQPTSYVDESIKYYKQAIELDPGFSNAYVGLGQCYWTLAHFSRDYDPVYWDSSKLSLQQAISLIRIKDGRIRNWVWYNTTGIGISRQR